MSKPVFIHDFDFMFSVPSFEADPDKVTPDEIIEQFKRTLAKMESWEIFERSGHVQTIDPDTHMTTARDWGLVEDRHALSNKLITNALKRGDI